MGKTVENYGLGSGSLYIYGAEENVFWTVLEDNVIYAGLSKYQVVVKERHSNEILVVFSGYALLYLLLNIVYYSSMRLVN